MSPFRNRDIIIKIILNKHVKISRKTIIIGIIALLVISGIVFAIILKNNSNPKNSPNLPPPNTSRPASPPESTQNEQTTESQDSQTSQSAPGAADTLRTGRTGETNSSGTTTPQPGSPVSPSPNTPPPPAVSYMGWELNASNTGLAPKGLSCSSLPLYGGSGKPSAGTVISEKRIDTSLDLSNGNITIEKSCIQPTSVGGGLPLITTTDYNNCPSGCALTPTTVTIRDSEIDGSLMSASAIAQACAFLGIGTIERNYIHDMGSGICMFNTGSSLSATIQGNYVHQLRAFGGSHNEAFTIRDFPTDTNPSRYINILNNRFDSSSGNDTGAAFLQTYGDDINNVLFEGNLLEGFGYQLGLEAGFGNIYGTSMRVNNNRFSGTGYGVGYVTDAGLGYGWSQWTNNYIYNAGAANGQGAPAVEPTP